MNYKQSEICVTVILLLNIVSQQFHTLFEIVHRFPDSIREEGFCLFLNPHMCHFFHLITSKLVTT